MSLPGEPCVCVRVCLWVWVLNSACAKEERDGLCSKQLNDNNRSCKAMRSEAYSVCVRVCVPESEREREREYASI